MTRMEAEIKLLQYRVDTLEEKTELLKTYIDKLIEILEREEDEPKQDEFEAIYGPLGQG